MQVTIWRGYQVGLCSVQVTIWWPLVLRGRSNREKWGGELDRKDGHTVDVGHYILALISERFSCVMSRKKFDIVCVRCQVNNAVTYYRYG